MANRSIEEVKSSKNFYRVGLRRISIAVFVCYVIILLLITGICLTFFRQHVPAYYATLDNGTIRQIQPAAWGSRFKNPNMPLTTAKPKEKVKVDTEE